MDVLMTPWEKRFIGGLHAVSWAIGAFTFLSCALWVMFNVRGSETKRIRRGKIESSPDLFGPVILMLVVSAATCGYVVAVLLTALEIVKEKALFERVRQRAGLSKKKSKQNKKTLLLTACLCAMIGLGGAIAVYWWYLDVFR
jgi:hypothetical protein